MSLPNHIIARLGTTSDAALAAEAGVPTHRIRYARAMRGIPSTRGSGPAWLSLRVIHGGLWQEGLGPLDLGTNGATPTWIPTVEVRLGKRW